MLPASLGERKSDAVAGAKGGHKTWDDPPSFPWHSKHTSIDHICTEGFAEPAVVAIKARKASGLHVG